MKYPEWEPRNEKERLENVRRAIEAMDGSNQMFLEAASHSPDPLIRERAKLFRETHAACNRQWEIDLANHKEPNDDSVRPAPIMSSETIQLMQSPYSRDFIYIFHPEADDGGIIVYPRLFENVSITPENS